MTKFRQLFSFSQKEIDEAFKAASHRDSILGLRLLEAPTTQEHGKLLIVIPRSAGNAIVRNKIRRRLKAIFYEEKLYNKPKTWILLIYKEASSMELEDLKKFLLKNIK